MASLEVWDALVDWLKSFEGGEKAVTNLKLIKTEGGRGLVAVGDLPPGTRLITIPEAALLNTKTIRPFYPDSFHDQLTSTQWISLHLALNYRRHGRSLSSLKYQRNSESSKGKKVPRDLFKPFIESIPYEFPTMPLHWSLASRTPEEICNDFEVDSNDESVSSRGIPRTKRKQWQILMDNMPSGVRKREADIEKRLKEDWLVARKVWSEHCASDNSETESFDFFDFALAWKNVNTRCVYYDLGRKTSDNLTLAPVIDMINHKTGMWTKPLQGHKSLSFSSPDARAPDGQLKDGDELAFSYGAHEDSMLLTEYGFILGNENPYNCVGVDEDIAALFDAQGDEGKLKRSILEDEQYWGEMTLQANPAPASASWRVLIALRLLHLRLPSRYVALAQETDDFLHPKITEALEPWQAIISGDADIISEANEAKVVASIRMICDQMGKDVAEGIKKCKEQKKKWKLTKNGEVDADQQYSLDALLGIWEGEKWIIDQVVAEL